MDPRLHLLGIRHHGPGSAALVIAALERLDPAAVLVEGAPEGGALVPFLAGLKPPVAMLFYAVDDPKAAMFAPFAEFSPEWQALHWAAAHGRPVIFIDWPAALSLAFVPDPDAPPRGGDVLGRLAAVAGRGDGDGEAFWNALVEESGGLGHPLATFQAIGEAMTEARARAEGEGELAQRRDLVREAHMRLAIRQALKDHAGPLAAIVGAWHVPALAQRVPPSEDRALLRDLPKVKVAATWAPWTDSRLALASGYGAGVVSPGWYRHLWRAHTSERQDAAAFAAVWQARTAALLRSEGLPASPASAIEAARLTLALCQIRDLAMPGLAEMREAALSALCHGEPTPLRLVERRLYIGESVGEIGEDVPQMPLARDLALWQRRTRLKPEDLESEIRLDLRTEAGLLKSTLLHRLAILNVPWGRLLDADSGRGTFRELWQLSWRPEHAVALAEALVYGVTLEDAAGNLIRDKARRAPTIDACAGLVRQALIADLPDAATQAIAELQALAVNASDLTDLMRTVAPLASVLRYGTARKLPDDALRALITALAVEVHAGIRIGSRHLTADASAARLAAMRSFDEALGLLKDEALTQDWRGQLQLIADDDLASPAVAGFALRRLTDLGTLGEDEVARAFARRMTGPPLEAGSFLDAFLAGSADLLLQETALIALVDAWLASLDAEGFMEVLPLLRRAFAGFDGPARQRFVNLVAKRRFRSAGLPAAALNPPGEDGTDDAFTAALPLLRMILGLEETA